MPPTYDYACIECGTSATELRAIADRDSPIYCQKCSQAMKRQLKVPGTVLKGLGWHNIEYTKHGPNK